MQSTTIEARLTEWARWCRSYGRRGGSCGSVEGRYRSPQHWDPITHAPGAPICIDAVAEVERVVTGLADPWHLCVVLHYIQQAPEPVVRRRLRRWRVNVPATLLQEAQRRIGERLAR